MQSLAVSEPEPEPEPEAARAQGQGICAVVLYEYEATEDNEMTLLEGELIEQIEELDEGWWSGVGPGGKTGMFPANYVQIVEQEAAPTTAPSPPPPPPPPPAVDEGITAIALYDYDAAEDNELTFKEGDRITEIEPASEDWWNGKGPGGEMGLFPANYVEVQE
ncbi:SH3 domain-containing protein [Desarmillaria ectypa]|nr:SH3 domain-containing protein [Desarmillaria ectypa]